MTAVHPPCSVIVVSRHRPTALRRCISALRQQDHDNFELIVVADPAAIAALPGGDDIRQIIFDAANVSAARNLGLMQAASGIVAFIDDDAVAEPFWLSRLTAPFADSEVVASTGFVRGRNGISWQWRANMVDHLGHDHPLDVTQTTVLPATKGRAVKTQGTNCAFRADALRAIGGFDPAYRFYLDEADVNLRLQGLTAVVPLAEVHHGYLPSDQRRADRTPRSLFEIAASTAVFLRRHAPDQVAMDDLQQRQSRRLQNHLAAGRLSAHQVAALLQDMALGWQDGLTRDMTPPTAMPVDNTEFCRLGGIGPRKSRLITGRLWSRKSLIRRAKEAVAQGDIVTLICLSPTRRAHWMGFDDAGFWMQTGGIWGRSDRADGRIIWGSFKTRVAQEIQRLTKVRPIDLN